MVHCSPELKTAERRCANTVDPLGLATTRNLRGDVVTDIYLATTAIESPTSLYLYYDSNGLLLYVGVTKRGVSRNHEHSATQEWWPFVARQEVEHFDTRREALVAEKATIQRLRPPFNKQHNPDHHLTREAYLTLREQGRLPSRITAYQQLKWLPLNFIDYDGNRFLYATEGAYAPYIDSLDKERYGFLCGLKKGKAAISREQGVLWVTIRGESGRISAPRLRVAPAHGKKRTYTVKGIDLIGDGIAHPVASRWSATHPGKRRVL